MFSGIIANSNEIQQEIEKIQAEKIALLSEIAGPKLPKPVPCSGLTDSTPNRRRRSGDDDDDDGFSGMDTVLSSVMKVVDGGPKIGPVTAEKILPGARSYEDIQKYLDSVKKEKLEKLKGQSKDFSKFSGRRW